MQMQQQQQQQQQQRRGLGGGVRTITAVSAILQEELSMQMLVRSYWPDRCRVNRARLVVMTDEGVRDYSLLS
jgi:hypothetical protein